MLKTFAKMLGLPIEAAEDALKSERLAQRVLSRRGFLAGATTALLTQNKVFGFLTDAVLERGPVMYMPARWGSSWAAAQATMAAMMAYMSETARYNGEPPPSVREQLAAIDGPQEPLDPLTKRILDEFATVGSY